MKDVSGIKSTEPSNDVVYSNGFLIRISSSTESLSAPVLNEAAGTLPDSNASGS